MFRGVRVTRDGAGWSYEVHAQNSVGETVRAAGRADTRGECKQGVRLVLTGVKDKPVKP